MFDDFERPEPIVEKKPDECDIIKLSNFTQIVATLTLEMFKRLLGHLNTLVDASLLTRAALVAAQFFCPGPEDRLNSGPYPADSRLRARR